MKRLFKHVTMYLCIIAMLFSLTPAVGSSAASKTDFAKKVYVAKGKSVKVKLKKSGSAEWKSSKKEIATVTDGGVVKGLKVGSTTLTAKLAGKTYKCKLIVDDPSLADEASVDEGKFHKLSVGGTNREPEWKSSNTKVLEVVEGYVLAKSAGTVTVTAKFDDITLKCKVTVNASEDSDWDDEEVFEDDESDDSSSDDEDDSSSDDDDSTTDDDSTDAAE